MIKLRHNGLLSTSSSTAKRALGTESKQRQTQKNKPVSFESTSSSTQGQSNISNLPIQVDLDPMLYGIAEDTNNNSVFNRLYKDIYAHDPVGGSTVDLYSSLPFSEFTLGGIDKSDISDIFYENIERLNIRTLLNELSIDHLVTGTFLGSLLYNPDKKLFFDIMPHDIANATLIPMPFYSQDPIISVKFPDDVRKALSHSSKRVDDIKEKLGKSVVDRLLSGSLELDPIGTIYLPRKTFAFSEGVSFYQRILAIYLIEKNLFRGTLVESAKRQRGILHITIGDGDQWEPTQADMESITDLFTSADADPLGAMITTRLGISTEEIRAGGDFWKWTDIVDQTTTMKMKALGISEAFLSGDQTLNCVIGTTLVPTSTGLQRIGSMCDVKYGNLQNINFLVGTRYGVEKATKWLYSGEHPTISVAAESGNNVTGTHKHRLLVLRDGSLDWVYLKDIKLSDYLCINPESVNRDTDYVIRSSGIQIDYRFAYILGCIIRKGYVSKNVYKIPLPGHCANLFIQYYNQLFGPVKQEVLRDKIVISIDDPVNSKLIDDLIGSKVSLPWCIAKTSYSSQLSFVAALVDLSSLQKIGFDNNAFGKELLCLLNSLGIMCNLKFTNLTLPEGEDYHLYAKIKQYCGKSYSTKKVPRLWYGIPDEEGAILPYDSNSIEGVKTLYRFVKVSSIKDAGVQKVYDLSINQGNPSYIANGLVSHNTMETSLTVFIEQLRAYRDRITRKLLYNKIFPLISMVNGLAIKNGKVSRSDKAFNMTDAFDVLQDGSKLLIPIVHWNKQLKPEGDSSYLDLLDRMTAAGVPIPLRAMAAAGGFNLDEILSQETDDLSMRKDVAAYMKKLEAYKAQPPDSSESSTNEAILGLLDESPSRASFSSVLSTTGKKSMLKRNFDPEIVGKTRTGKKKLIIDQRGANNTANSNIVKAVRRIKKQGNSSLTNPTHTAKE